MGNTENIELLWRQFSSALRSFIISRIGNEDDAEDLLQNVFIKIHGNIGSLKDQSRIKPWIYQITRNIIIDYFRSRDKFMQIPESFDGPDDQQENGSFMDEAIGDMTRMLNGLDPDYCEALCLTELGGLTQKQYADMKGLTYSGAKSRVQRARSLLKQELLKCCHYHFDKYGLVYDIHPKCCCCKT